MTHRTSGILLHPTSLPGPHGTGDLGRSAHDFAAWLERAGQLLWQILPLGPTGLDGSPYGSASAFAGNPFLIAPDLLVREGLITRGELADQPTAAPDAVDYPQVAAWKESVLRLAWKTFQTRRPPELRTAMDDFLNDSEVAYWLDDWALFAALKRHHRQAPWHEWPAPERQHQVDAIDSVRKHHAEEIDFQRFTQFLFYSQLRELRDVARRYGVQLFGDMPIYAGVESADLWGHQELFQLNGEGRPTAVAGVPPDYFSEHGQLWGNPLYNWETLRDTGYEWWVRRLRWWLRWTDLVRIDHFRGLAAYWSVPAGAETAATGEWQPGPGMELFAAFKRSLGPELPIVAEDLGVITPDVDGLRRAAGLPGMRVLQFGFSEPDNLHLPHNYTVDTVAYTGTHDNDTVHGWFATAPQTERRRALLYLGGTPDEIHRSFVRAVFTSGARTAIAPLQDVLGLGSEARLNQPGLAENQWRWRLGELPSDRHAEWLRAVTEATGRAPRSS